MSRNELIIEGARQNNLRNISLTLPHNRLIAITGVSGSGKSSLAFDTLFAEGQWRFIESLSTYARLFLEKMDRPDVDSIRNIRPAIALEQKNPVKSSRSTVGTATEAYDYLRLLFAKIGRPHCPECGDALKAWNPSSVFIDLTENYSGAKAMIIFESGLSAEELRKAGFHRVRESSEKLGTGRIEVILDRLIIRDEPRLADSIETAWDHGRGVITVEIVGPEGGKNRQLRYQSELKCLKCNLTLQNPQPLLFSFNHPLGACPACRGFGNALHYSEDVIVPDRELSLAAGAIEPWSKPSNRWWYRQFAKKAETYGIDLKLPYKDLPDEARRLIFEGTDDFCGINDFFEELERKRYKLHVRVFLSRYRKPVTCPDCNGTRLRTEALAFRLGGHNIAELSSLSITNLQDTLRTLDLNDFESEVAAEILRQLDLKLSFLERVGIGYLTMDREARTLSGGEAQRINLSNQLASKLTGTLYVLDEPTVGLHPRDVGKIAEILKELAGTGNTVVTVEHDRAIIDVSDWIVELGPGGGENGGRIVFSGSKEEFWKADTLTAGYLKDTSLVPVPHTRRQRSEKSLVVTGASGNNLKEIDVRVPLGLFVCVTGVSGSGKSTFVRDTVYKSLANRFRIDFDTHAPFRELYGAENLKGVKIIDQKPIGKSPRSNPVTYIKAFDHIRKVFASLPQARALGFTPGHFSFNTEGGRCEACMGAGFQQLEMYFFEDLYIVCEECSGRRYRPEVLNVSYNGKNINDVLEMTVSGAIDFFSRVSALVRKLKLMESVGLGYLRLGQPATTLSGGESQRLKICAELGTASRRDYLYILDEPTVGLHPDDIKKLLKVLNDLVDAGNTVLVVEHNLDVIKSADWIIDLGPEGGEAGGRVIAEGTPEELARHPGSYTARYLREYLDVRV
jgi:excinuclease ABC subunit A